jgi:uncharacterized protein YdiU (UPF0061 family)
MKQYVHATLFISICMTSVNVHPSPLEYITKNISFLFSSLSCGHKKSSSTIKSHDPCVIVHSCSKTYPSTASLSARAEEQLIAQAFIQTIDITQKAAAWFDDFFNSRNDNSYNKHLNDFKPELDAFEKTVIIPLHQHRNNRIIELTDNLIENVYRPIKETLAVLNKYRSNHRMIGLPHPSLGLELKEIKSKFNHDYNLRVQQMFNELKAVLAHAHPSLMPQVHKLEIAIDKARAEQNKRTLTHLIKGLTHRVNC